MSWKKKISNLDAQIKGDLREWINDLNVNLEDMTKETSSQPASYAYIGTLGALARKEKLKAKLELQVVEARVRSELKNRGEKLTVEDLKSMIAIDQRVLMAQAELISAEETFDVLEALREGWRQKADMIKIFADNVRKEMQFKGQA